MSSARSFTITVPDAVLARIAARVADARIGYAPADDHGGWSYGTDARYLAEFVAFWRDHYDWRAAERATRTAHLDKGVLMEAVV